MLNAVDLFSGSGGWCEGIKDLDVHPLGIEIDETACKTREAAGHRTLRADVSELDPLEFAPCDLLIASPPCPTFSNAGKREGMDDWPLVEQCARNMFRGHDNRHAVRPKLTDARSLLVVEPLRWVLALRPTLVALEQVPPVLPLWKLYARMLEEEGWSTWSGLLSAERFGVPQTRERAFLMASRAGHVSPPLPTHQEYRPGEPAVEQHTMEGTLSPWVSMAEALGWGMTERPEHTVTAGGTDTGGAEPIGAGARRGAEAQRRMEGS